MADRIFRIFNPREPKGDPVEKRRAQLRRAQQSYRDRKDKYTKVLEAELARSRKSEAGLASEVEQLRGKVSILITLLSQNGISVPSDFDDKAGTYDDAVSYISPSQLTARGGTRAADGRLSSSVSPSAATTASQGNTVNDEDRYSERYGSSFFIEDDEPQLPPRGTSAVTSPAQATGDTCLAHLDATLVGMEFVLTLERPCLGHVHGNPKKPLEPGGHALTTTVQLQASLSLPPIDPKNPVPPSYHNAPAVVLDRLLNLAPSVSADGDVTPIQAWHYIRRQPHFGEFDMQSLNRLAQKLRDASKCHGFGAAVQTGVFESVVREVLHPVTLILT